METSWYQVTMTNDEIADGRHAQLFREFSDLFTLAGAPQTAALFSSRSPESTGVVVTYFSPGSMEFAQAIITAYAGKPCEPPPPNASLLVGHQDAFDML